MKNDNNRAVRFTFEQDHVIDELGNIETFCTAVISFIGYQLLAECRQALAALNYGERRFSSPNGNIAGRWIEQTERFCRKAPEMVLGLILVNASSAAAARSVWTEIKRYSAAGSTPMVACLAGESERIILTERIAHLSAKSDLPYHFVASIGERKSHSDKRNGCSTGGNTASTIHLIEALLASTTFPGLICVDLADVLTTIEGHKNLNIFRTSATSFETLMSLISKMTSLISNKSGVISTLFAPLSLKLSQLEVCFTTLKAQLPDDTVMVVAAVADREREEFTLYLVFSE